MTERTPPRDPFLEDRHRDLADKVRALGDRRLRAGAEDDADPRGRTIETVGLLARTGILNAAVPAPFGSMDLRSVVVVRESLAYFSSLADTAFAMQGLGSYPIARAGSEAQKNRWLPAVVAGQVLCAFAVTEPEAGSDLAGLRCHAERDGALWRLSGVKTFISNAGIAGLYTVLARSRAGEGSKGLSLFLVDAGSPGITVRALDPIAPHPLGEVRFDGVPAVVIGEEGQGYKLALATLDTFRPAVGAAACGLAERALDEALRWSLARRQFGRPLAEFQSIQMSLAEMHVEIEAARLLVRRAAWARDQGQERITLEAASAKLVATEMAQRVVDRAVQIHGGQGVMRGATVERLYREVRALRIYEGTSEIQKLVIANCLLRDKR
jgi:alkylation response protein AidB-like acyl-CoA dehydrogenase